MASFFCFWNVATCSDFDLGTPGFQEPVISIYGESRFSPLVKLGRHVIPQRKDFWARTRTSQEKGQTNRDYNSNNSGYSILAPDTVALWDYCRHLGNDL